MTSQPAAADKAAPPRSHPALALSAELLARANPKAASALAFSLLESADPVCNAQGELLAAPCLAESFSQRSVDAAGLRLFALLLGRLEPAAALTLIKGREAKLLASLSRLLPLLCDQGAERLGESLPAAFQKAQASTLAQSPASLRRAAANGVLNDAIFFDRLLQEFALERTRFKADAQTASPPSEGWEWLCSARPELIKEAFIRIADIPDQNPELAPILSQYPTAALRPLFTGSAAPMAAEAFANSKLPETLQFAPIFLQWTQQGESDSFIRHFCSFLFKRQSEDPDFKARSNAAFIPGALSWGGQGRGALELTPLKERSKTMRPVIWIEPLGWADLPVLITVRRREQRPNSENYLNRRMGGKVLAALQGIQEGDPKTKLRLALRCRVDANGDIPPPRDLGHAAAHALLLLLAPGLAPDDLAESAGRFLVPDHAQQEFIKELDLSGEPQRLAIALFEAVALNAMTKQGRSIKRKPAAKPSPKRL